MGTIVQKDAAAVYTWGRAHPVKGAFSILASCAPLGGLYVATGGLAIPVTVALAGFGAYYMSAQCRARNAAPGAHIVVCAQPNANAASVRQRVSCCSRRRKPLPQPTVVAQPQPPAPRLVLPQKPNREPVLDATTLYLKDPTGTVCPIYGEIPQDGVQLREFQEVGLLSAYLQAFFLNEPTIIQELPAAIVRGLKESSLIGTRQVQQELDALQTHKSAYHALFALCALLRQSSIDRNDLSALLENLTILSTSQHINNSHIDQEAVLKLLVLVQLDDIINHVQTCFQVDISKIRALGGLIHKYSKQSSQTARGLCKLLTDLIMKDSPLQPRITIRRRLDYNPDLMIPVDQHGVALKKGEGIAIVASDNGWRTLPVQMQKWGSLSVERAFHDSLQPPNPSNFQCKTNARSLEGLPAPFTVTKETHKFTTQPPFLILDNTANRQKTMHLDSSITLEGESVETNRGALYDLCGVVLESGCAFAKKDTTWYRFQVNYPPCILERGAPRSAKDVVALVYRLVPRRA